MDRHNQITLDVKKNSYHPETTNLRRQAVDEIWAPDAAKGFLHKNLGKAATERANDPDKFYPWTRMCNLMDKTQSLNRDRMPDGVPEFVQDRWDYKQRTIATEHDFFA